MVFTSQIITWVVTFFFFTIEAILHYNLGKTASKDSNTIKNNNKDDIDIWKLVQIPPLEEMKKIAVIVGTVSLLSTITINFIENKYKF
jgi:preprotein translocase subunit SecG